jgi:hypothetical protein
MSPKRLVGVIATILGGGEFLNSLWNGDFQILGILDLVKNRLAIILSDSSNIDNGELNSREDLLGGSHSVCSRALIGIYAGQVEGALVAFPDVILREDPITRYIIGIACSGRFVR